SVLPSPTPGTNPPVTPVAPMPPADTTPKPMPPAPSGGTYLYDGGPNSPVPMPTPQIQTTPDGRTVSLTGRANPPKLVYPAYGELPRYPQPRASSPDPSVRQVSR